MRLFEKLDEIHANSVTPKEFEETWGKSLDKYKDELADYVEQLYESYNEDAEVNNPTEVGLQPAAVPAAAAKASTTVEMKERSENNDLKSSLCTYPHSEKNNDGKSSILTSIIGQYDGKSSIFTIISQYLARKIQDKQGCFEREIIERLTTNAINTFIETFYEQIEENLVSEMSTIVGKILEEEVEEAEVKDRRLFNKKKSTSWEFKLLAVNTESEKRIIMGTPVVIKSLCSSVDDMSIVAKKLSLKKEVQGATSISATEKGMDTTEGMKVSKPNKGIDILFSDIGRLDVEEIFENLRKVEVPI